MKDRVKSGVIIALITISAVLIGGLYFKAVAAFIVIWGAKEFCSCRNHPINYAEYAIMLVGGFALILFPAKTLAIILCLLIAFVSLAIFNEKVSFADACVSFLETTILGVSVYQMLEIEAIDKFLFGYVIIIAYLTDVFALLCGMKFGKHKLNERISPKKTIEGAIGGWVMGLIISFVWSLFFNYFGLGFSFILTVSILGPIVSQIGDLCFSLIKRHYGVKDFSNLIPGHGGLLDRLDSLIFVLLIFNAVLIFLG